MKKIIIVTAAALAAFALAGCGASEVAAPVTVPNTAATATVTPSPVTVQPTVTVQPPTTVTTSQAPVTVTQTQTQAPTTVTQSQSTGPDTTAGRQVASDHSVAESTIGYWIPQLSSNPSSSEAMARFSTTQATYPDAFMIWSSDYSTSQTPNYYITLVPREFSTAAEANAWCDSEGFSPGNCFAKRLSHTDGPAGNSVERDR